MTAAYEELMKVTFVSSGKFVSGDEWIHPQRIIDTFEIIYVIEGCVFIQEEDEPFAVTEGGVLLLRPQKKHFGYRKSTGKTSFYWVHFNDPELFVFNNIDQFFNFNDTYHLHMLFKQLLHLENTPGYPKYAVNLTLWLIVTEIATKQKEHIRKYSPVLKDVREWIRINQDRMLTVKDVACEFGYNEDYLTRVFRKNFSLGIKEYINEEKIKTIKNLLLSTSYPIKQIALEVGFDHYKNFLKYFKYHEGISPMVFRKIYFNTHTNKK